MKCTRIIAAIGMALAMLVLLEIGLARQQAWAKTLAEPKMFPAQVRNVHFKMSHLDLERRPHSQRNVGAFVMIIPQPLFHLKGELRDF